MDGSAVRPPHEKKTVHRQHTRHGSGHANSRRIKQTFSPVPFFFGWRPDAWRLGFVCFQLSCIDSDHLRCAQEKRNMKKERRENLFIEITITIDVIHWSVGNENKSTRNTHQREEKKVWKCQAILRIPFFICAIQRRKNALKKFKTFQLFDGTHAPHRAKICEGLRKNVNANGKNCQEKNILFSVEELNCFIGNRISLELYTVVRPFCRQNLALHSFRSHFLFLHDWMKCLLRRCHAQRPPYDNNNQLVHRTEQRWKWFET